MEGNFRKERKPEFYANALAVALWFLNFLTSFYRHKTVYELLQDRRHKETIKLFGHSILSVKEIAYELGFVDSPCFIMHFKKPTREIPGWLWNKNKIRNVSYY